MKYERNINLTKDEKRSSLETQFWNDKQKMDRNSKLYKEIQKVCKNIKFNK